jgi:hypothetical protein
MIAKDLALLGRQLLTDSGNQQDAPICPALTRQRVCKQVRVGQCLPQGGDRPHVVAPLWLLAASLSGLSVVSSLAATDLDGGGLPELAHALPAAVQAGLLIGSRQ